MPSRTLRLFRQLTRVPTAPFHERAVLERALGWARGNLGRSVRVRRLRGGAILHYAGAGPGPSLAFAAHLDHPGFSVLSSGPRKARARLLGGLPKDFLPGARVEGFPARPAGNRPCAVGTLGLPRGEVYPVAWDAPPNARPAFAVNALTPFRLQGGWLDSRSIDDLLGCAVSLEALRRLVRARARANVKVLLHRAEEVGFIGALDLALRRALPPGDSVLSVETSRRLPGAAPGKGPVIRTGDRLSLFDPALLGLLDDAALRLRRRGLPVQRRRLTGGSCEATAYQAFGYESAGVSVPLVNYHNRGARRIEPERVRAEDAEGAVRLLVEAARLFPDATQRGRVRERLARRYRRLSRDL